MSVDTLPSEAPPAAVRGVAEIAFEGVGEAAHLTHLYQSDPMRVLFPEPPAGEPPTAVLVTTSGGLVGGDTIAVTVSVGAESRALITFQAAEKVYRSTGAECQIDSVMRVAEGG